MKKLILIHLTTNVNVAMFVTPSLPSMCPRSLTTTCKFRFHSFYKMHSLSLSLSLFFFFFFLVKLQIEGDH